MRDYTKLKSSREELLKTAGFDPKRSFVARKSWASDMEDEKQHMGIYNHNKEG